MALPAIAAIIAGGAMAYWASTNVYQTHKISGDRQTQLDWEREKFYTDIAHDYELYEQDITKIGLVAGFDALDRQSQSLMQEQRLHSQIATLEHQQAQDDYERNIYLTEKAFDSSVGQEFKTMLGDENNVYKLTYILGQLLLLQNPDLSNRQIPNTLVDTELNDDDYNFDYFTFDESEEEY